jgi:hypothetical protein
MGTSCARPECCGQVHHTGNGLHHLSTGLLTSLHLLPARSEDLLHGLVPSYHQLLHLCQVLHTVTVLVEQCHRVTNYLDYTPHFILLQDLQIKLGVDDIEEVLLAIDTHQLALKLLHLAELHCQARQSDVPHGSALALQLPLILGYTPDSLHNPPHPTNAPPEYDF